MNGIWKYRLYRLYGFSMLCKAPVPLSRIGVRINANDIACEWRWFFPWKKWGSYRVYLYAEPERFDTMIICESMRIRHEINTNWYDAVRCNKMQHDGDTMQYEAVRWWCRINTIALWCDENTIEPNRNVHEPMRTCAIQYDNTIVAHRIATYWVAADRRRIPVQMYKESIRMYNDEIRTNRNWHELIRRSAMQYDAVRMGSIHRPIRMFRTFQNIRIGLRTNTKVAAN